MSNNRVRNAVIIIILCIIGGYSAYKPTRAPLGLRQPAQDGLKDAVAGDRVRRGGTTPAGLHLSNTSDDEMRDAVAGNAIPTGRRVGPPHGNTEGSTPPPPRGGEHHGHGPLSVPSPASQLSPSGPGE